MSRRSIEILDAAIRVLGTSGIRGLTHRAVDAEAGVPPGSTSNLFRSRNALLEGVLGRVLDRDMSAWTRLADETEEFDIDFFAAVVGRMLGELASTDRVFALARFAIFVEAGLHDELSRRIDETHVRLSAWATPLIAALGSQSPRVHLPLVMSYLDGLLINQLVHPVPTFDPTAAIAAFLHTLVQDPATRSDVSPARTASP